MLLKVASLFQKCAKNFLIDTITDNLSYSYKMFYRYWKIYAIYYLLISHDTLMSNFMNVTKMNLFYLLFSSWKYITFLLSMTQRLFCFLKNAIFRKHWRSFPFMSFSEKEGFNILQDVLECGLRRFYNTAFTIHNSLSYENILESIR